MEKSYDVPFGESLLSFNVPEGISAQVVVPVQQSPLIDPEGAIQSALDTPLASPTLEELADKIKPRTVCIAFTDATRTCPDHLLVPAILDRLRAAGVSDGAIILLCAVGLHRASTVSEKRAKLGGSIVDHFRVINHDASDEHNLVQVDCAKDGTPFEVNRLAYDADLLIATGVVEPHQYAGYSGGAKTVTIGCGGEGTIAATHGPAMLGRPGVRLGRIEGNPFQETVRHVASQAGLDFVFNVVQDDQRRILNVAAGTPAAVHDHLVGCARRVFEVPVRRQYDLAVVGVGAPKDVNLYQASRAITYLQLAPVPVVRPGGILILPAPCPEGAGQGVGEQRFLAALRDAPDVSSLLEKMRVNGYQPGAQRAFVLGQVLVQNEVIVVGAQNPQLICDCKMISAATMEEAFSIALRKLGTQCRALVVPHALQTVVRVTS